MDPDRIRSSLEDRIRFHRRDAAVFALATVFLTPFFVTAAVVAVAFALEWIGVDILTRTDRLPSLPTIANVALALMALTLFLRPRSDYDGGFALPWGWISAAGLAFVGMLALTYGTGLVSSSPGLFWACYGALGLAMLALLGHAYEPADDYYLGWEARWAIVDNPMTIRDDVDRAHLALGFAVAFPRLLFGSWAAILGSAWLWRGLGPAETGVAIDVLRSLARQDLPGASRAARTCGPRSAARVLRALDKMGLIRPTGSLTLEGEKLFRK